MFIVYALMTIAFIPAGFVTWAPAPPSTITIGCTCATWHQEDVKPDLLW